MFCSFVLTKSALDPVELDKDALLLLMDVLVVSSLTHLYLNSPCRTALACLSVCIRDHVFSFSDCVLSTDVPAEMIGELEGALHANGSLVCFQSPFLSKFK